MKATGIVRRIDDLGRVVIPKEIRRTLRIKEGQPLEIYTDTKGEIILKKYSSLSDLSEFAEIYATAINKEINTDIIVCDNEKVIVAKGSSVKKFLDKEISEHIEKILNTRALFNEPKNTTCIFDNEDFIPSSLLIMPIINEGDIIGGLILVSEDPFTNMEEGILKVGSNFISRQISE